MTKVEAIKKVLEDNGGSGTLEIIYKNIEKYYPDAKKPDKWDAGIRGVLYRAIGKDFKKIGLGVFALANYKEEAKTKEQQLEVVNNPIRMHSFIEGICVELGNFEKFDTFSADLSADYRDNVKLKDLCTLNKDNFPNFTYPEIIKRSKLIDVLWFNNKGFKFPKRAFEIVDSIGTLGEALNRTYQLSQFDLEFYIVGKKEDKLKFEDKISLEPYIRIKDRYKYFDYDYILEYYNKKLEIQNYNF